MRKVTGSRPDGVQDLKKKKAYEAWVIWRRKRGGKKKIEKQKIGEKTARDVARERAQSNPPLFIR